MNDTIDQAAERIITNGSDSIKGNRYVYFLIIVSSVFFFLGYWNSLESSWQMKRMEKTSMLVLLDDVTNNLDPNTDPLLHAEYQIHLSEKDKIDAQENEVDLNRIKALESFDSRVVKFLYDKKLINSEEKENLEKIFVNDKKIFKSYLSETNNILKLQREKFTESTLIVSLPFFGIMLDINDLSLLSGVSYIILLLALIYSSVREYKVLRVVFDAIEGIVQRLDFYKLGIQADETKAVYIRDLRLRYYQLVSNTNLLTPSPRIVKESSDGTKGETSIEAIRRFFMGYFVKTLLIIPLLIQWIIFNHDNNTKHIATELLANEKFEMMQSMNWIFIITMTALILLCFSLEFKIEKIWNDEARRVQDPFASRI